MPLRPRLKSAIPNLRSRVLTYFVQRLASLVVTPSSLTPCPMWLRFFARAPTPKTCLSAMLAPPGGLDCPIQKIHAPRRSPYTTKGSRPSLLEPKGAAKPHASANGNMFTLLHPSPALAIGLPEDKREDSARRRDLPD